MEDLIKVKCPFCGSLLQFKKRVDFICPVCKSKSLVADCQNSLGKKDKEKTVIEDKNPNSATGDTSKNILIGCLVEKSGKSWELHLGSNTVGRKLQKPPQQVDVPVFDYSGEKRMIRKHAKIEVARLTNGCSKHILQNWQNKNPTYISGEQLRADDRIVLQNGMIIKFANIEVKFIIKDSEETNL